MKAITIPNDALADMDSCSEGIIIKKPKDGKVKIEYYAECGYAQGSVEFDVDEMRKFLGAV